MPWSRAVRDAADKACFPIYRGMKCFVCGSEFCVAGHHIIRRSASNRFRHDICNVVPLCAKCHRRVELRPEYHMELAEQIRNTDELWHAYIMWAIGASREHEKPDYQKALAFWQAHEDSGLTIEEQRTKFLQDQFEENTQ